MCMKGIIDSSGDPINLSSIEQFKNIQKPDRFSVDIYIGMMWQFCQLQAEGQSLMRAATLCCA